jgi:hypothetical protein
VRRLPAGIAYPLLLAAALSGCAARSVGAGETAVPGAAPLPAGSSASASADPDSLAAALRRQSIPASPRQLQFGWSLDEAGSRFSGSGVARIQAPERFRLDLFGPRGESYLAAALVGDTPRVPASVMERFRLPSAALLGATVGVVRPPSGARLASASESEGRVELRYELGADGVLEYRAQGGRLLSLRRLKGSAVQESVELERTASGELKSARYRDWIAYRNLNLTLESIRDTTAFAEDVWSPPGT